MRGRLSLFQYPQGINLHKIFYTPAFSLLPTISRVLCHTVDNNLRLKRGSQYEYEASLSSNDPDFFKNWVAYITLIFTLNLILTFIIVPIMRWLTKFIMVQNDVPYVSYTNFGWLLTKRPLAVIELVALALVILLIVFWQFAFLIQGVEGIHHDQERRLTRITLSALQDDFRC